MIQRDAGDGTYFAYDDPVPPPVGRCKDGSECQARCGSVQCSRECRVCRRLAWTASTPCPACPDHKRSPDGGYPVCAVMDCPQYGTAHPPLTHLTLRPQNAHTKMVALVRELAMNYRDGLLSAESAMDAVASAVLTAGATATSRARARARAGYRDRR